MFIRRLVSGIILLIGAVALFISGGVPLWIAVLIISLIGQSEFYNAMGIKDKIHLTYIGYALALIYYLLVFFDVREYLSGMIVASLMLFMALYVITFPKYKTEEISTAFFGICYVPVLLSYICMIRSRPDGVYTVWLVILCSWGCDTLSYCAGMLFGKHRMTPVLSPMKTWEGTIGGVLGAAILGFIYGCIFRSRMATDYSPLLTCSLACAFGAIISIFGDLAASGIKRNHYIKDFGSCIPGHGGILDRFDSMLFTAPVVYYSLLQLERFLQR